MSRRLCNRESDQPLCKQCEPLHDPLEDKEDSQRAGSVMVNDAQTVEDEEQFNSEPSVESPATSSFQHAQGPALHRALRKTRALTRVMLKTRELGKTRVFSGPAQHRALGDVEHASHALSTTGLGTSFQSNDDQHDVVSERPDLRPQEASSATASCQDQQNTSSFSEPVRCGPSSRVLLARPLSFEVTQPESQPAISSAGSPQGWVPSTPTGVSYITADV